jgi:hypothetical protein
MIIYLDVYRYKVKKMNNKNNINEENGSKKNKKGFLKGLKIFIIR